MLYALYALLLALVAFLAVVFLRALRFRPRDEAACEQSEAAIDEEKAISDLAELIRCKTVSYYEEERIDKAAFQRFRELLKTLYPNVFRRCTLESVDKTGLLLSLKGESAEAPAVLMAHYDVVPVDEAGWDKPAFDGIIEDGVLWGRGTLDTKGTLCGILEAAETLLKDGFVPKHDLYFAFAGDEEIAGNAQPAIVETLRSRGVVPALVLDEGGAVVENVFPGVTEPCALIGIAEKGLMDVRFSLDGAGGHASAPPPHTALGRLAKTILEVENKPFGSRMTKPVSELFDTLGRRSTFLYRVIFANLWCFLPVLDALCRKSGGELNAMMRTTVAFTMTEGSNARNVLPPHCHAIANLRIIGGETQESVLAALKARVSDPDVKLEVLEGMNPSRCSETDGYGWRLLKTAVRATWPEAIVSPYLMVACSDSRHYGVISGNVYRFSAMALSKEERGMIHGNNERIPTDKIVKTAQFYLRLMRSL